MIAGARGLLLLLALCATCAHWVRSEQVALKDIEDQQEAGSVARANKLLAVPSGLTRFFFYNSRPSDRQAAQVAGLSQVGGYKRSSSSLDALTGVTLGKRSAPLELLNYEPLFGRLNAAVRLAPRMYDLRWAPFDSFDGPLQVDYRASRAE